LPWRRAHPSSRASNWRTVSACHSRLGARSGIGNLPLGIDGNIEALHPHAHDAVLPESGGATIALRVPGSSLGCPGF
jgi:hypothetical protein